MDNTRVFWRTLRHLAPSRQPLRRQQQQHRPYICSHCLRKPTLKPSYALRLHRLRRPQSTNARSQDPAENPDFQSVLDRPAPLIRSGNRHKPWGLALLAAIPLTAFALGCWQVQRLGWKTDLIARFEDRLVRDPLPLPPTIDPDAVSDFDYRRVTTTGTFQHDKEMLIGPRIHDGEAGYLVVTPLERSATFAHLDSSRTNPTILVNRGWIPKHLALQSARPLSLPHTPQRVSGLLRTPWLKNAFTPSNTPEQGKWYFPDVHQMASHTGSQPIWVEETMTPDLLETYRRKERGVPIGRPAEVNLRNNHVQYIFTWFSLSLATSVMLWMVVKKPPGGGGRGGVGRAVRQNTRW